MKPQENELVSEISKLQSMVSELKTGFSSALMELSQIQLGDTFLREELEENRKSCHKKAQRMETLVEALKEELSVVRCQILQLYSNRPRPQPETKTTNSSKPRDSDPSEPLRSQCQCSSASGLSRGKLLLHCFLQGLKAGLSEGTDARHQVAMQLLHSEWEYVSTLNQLYDKYRTPPAHQMELEPYQTYLKFVEQLLQRHLLFRNTLQERLSAEHWKSLVGDILVQLIGQNDTSFSDMYLGYTTTLASFLSLEFNRLNQTEKSLKPKQSGHLEREEMKLLSLLLAPVSRIHSYLSHIQSLLQWTGKDHPDCSLLLGSEQALRTVLSRCHQILQQDVRWEEEEGASGCPETGACGGPPVNCCPRTVQSQEENKTSTQREDLCLSNGFGPCPSMRVECLSCSPVRRKGAVLQEPSRECAHCSLLTPDPHCWAETSDSGQGTYSHHTTRGTNDEGPHADLHDGDTDDTFDYSSVTSCSPDGTLRRDGDSPSAEEEEEEDSQVPVLLKPQERTVCLRWQIPRLTPHPPLRNPTALNSDGTAPGPVHNKRLVSVRKGSPPLHPKSAFRPIWDDPTKQMDSAPERDNRQGFIPIQSATRQSFQVFNTHRENLRQSLLQQRGAHTAVNNSRGLWDDSEDSEGPCSTV